MLPRQSIPFVIYFLNLLQNLLNTQLQQKKKTKKHSSSLSNLFARCVFTCLKLQITHPMIQLLAYVAVGFTFYLTGYPWIFNLKRIICINYRQFLTKVLPNNADSRYHTKNKWPWTPRPWYVSLESNFWLHLLWLHSNFTYIILLLVYGPTRLHKLHQRWTLKFPKETKHGILVTCPTGFSTFNLSGPVLDSNIPRVEERDLTSPLEEKYL